MFLICFYFAILIAIAIRLYFAPFLPVSLITKFDSFMITFGKRHLTLRALFISMLLLISKPMVSEMISTFDLVDFFVISLAAYPFIQSFLLGMFRAIVSMSFLPPALRDSIITNFDSIEADIQELKKRTIRIMEKDPENGVNIAFGTVSDTVYGKSIAGVTPQNLSEKIPAVSYSNIFFSWIFAPILLIIMIFLPWALGTLAADFDNIRVGEYSRFAIALRAGVVFVFSYLFSLSYYTADATYHYALNLHEIRKTIIRDYEYMEGMRHKPGLPTHLSGLPYENVQPLQPPPIYPGVPPADSNFLVSALKTSALITLFLSVFWYVVWK
jgi:hypothetical protein